MISPIQCYNDISMFGISKKDARIMPCGFWADEIIAYAAAVRNIHTLFTLPAYLQRESVTDAFPKHLRSGCKDCSELYRDYSKALPSRLCEDDGRTDIRQIKGDVQ